MVKTVLPLKQGSQVQSLIREPRSCMPHSTTKINKINRCYLLEGKIMRYKEEKCYVLSKQRRKEKPLSSSWFSFPSLPYSCHSIWNPMAESKGYILFLEEMYWACVPVLRRECSLTDKRWEWQGGGFYLKPPY